MSAAPHLHLIEGEVAPECAGCMVKADEIEGLEGVVRSLSAKITQLKRDKEREAREHQLWPAAVGVVQVWRRLCKHPRAGFGAAEFELMRPILQDKSYGRDLDARCEMCLRAVCGAAFDPFTTRRKNGSVKRHDGLDLIFRDRSKFQEFCNRAPANWREMLSGQEVEAV